MQGRTPAATAEVRNRNRGDCGSKKSAPMAIAAKEATNGVRNVTSGDSEGGKKNANRSRKHQETITGVLKK